MKSTASRSILSGLLCVQCGQNLSRLVHCADHIPGPNAHIPHMQSSADKALDKLHQPLYDWTALQCDLRITRRVKFLQR